jgi:predicted glycogen debranching enzyme
MSVADSITGIPFLVPKDVCRDFSQSSQLEWLETNHTGAFAMGTVAGVNTRRYHALLIASQSPPADRISVLPRVEETVSVLGREFELGTAQYPGAVQPRGFDLLEEFRIDPFPRWRYNLNGVTVEKSICLIDNRQSVLVRYKASHICTLRVRIMLSLRDYHGLAHTNSALKHDSSFSKGICTFRPYPDLPSLTIFYSGYGFSPDANWYLNHEYLRELDRGLDYREDLYSPGSLLFDVLADSDVWFLATIEADTDREELNASSIESLIAAERKRRVFRSPISRALDQFRVVREDGTPSLIAGYPWFTDWSRDTLISLPAFARSGFPAAETKAILAMLLRQRSQGLLPNRFSDSRGTVEYNTVDAALWFFVAAFDYIRQTGDREFLAEALYPAALDIIDWHNRGTAYDIKNDPSDNLLEAGIPGVQLTWMDAKIGDYVVTPRIGKPVEINALWYNSLRITADWASTLGHHADAGKLSVQAGATKASFNQKFWNDSEGCLYDVLAPSGNDSSIRPNQLFSASLPFAVLTRERAQAVVTVVRQKLLTPMGIRTLAPDDQFYRPRFEGDMRSRDSAYHQGTVWPWLVGPFVAAYLYAFGQNAFSLGYCRAVLKSIETQMGACALGSISEVYDGNAPQRPSGCPAQLWSVAQLALGEWLTSDEATSR